MSEPVDGPAIVLIHGWSQSLDCWDRLFEGPLARQANLVAYDLRGHGRSDAPVGADHYSAGERWADDLTAVIDQCCPAGGPLVLAAWSYGGFIVSDYLRHRASASGRPLAGIAFIGASVTLDEAQVPHFLAPAFPPLAERAASDDAAEAEAAIREFVALCPAEPLAPATLDAIVATNLLTRPDVRAALGDRVVRSDEVLGDLDVPVLVIQGLQDPIVLPATAVAIAAACPRAEVIEYKDVGHLPMIEAPERLAADLARFATTSSAGVRPLRGSHP
ncbi:MAG: alpha/beta fold hydrolase [Acidimicrobiales bacterium]